MYTKRLFASILAGTILASGIPLASATTTEPDLSKVTVTAEQKVSDSITYTDTTVTYQGVTFKRQQNGVYAGLPLFDANPDHINQYLDVYLDYIGLDGIVRIGIEKRNDYTLTNKYTFSKDYADKELAGKTITWDNKNAGKVIPGSPQFAESVQGYSTNFPAQIGVGQTWNKDLVAQEGKIVGTEKLYDSNISNTDGSYLSNANVMVSSALTDVRINPLSGRIDESYAEDPYLASVMVNAMAGGVTGHDQKTSDDGFWQMAFVDTKHFTNYLAQWQRSYGSFFNSARGLIEYMAKSTYTAFENNNIGCFLTTYGTTNYIPNGMSPMINYVKEMSDYPISTINDNGAETAPAERLGNEYMDSYWPTRAEQIISQAFANASAGYQQSTPDSECDDIYATVYAIQTGKMGMTIDDLKEQAKGAIINQIRCGLLNERDENGNPIGYPFIDIATSDQVYDYTNKEHQQVALQMAEECSVPLKNDNNLLPLSKDTNVTVTGPLADVRFTTTYTGTAYAGENMGLTPLGGIMELTGKTKEQLNYTTGAKQVKLKDSNGNYIKINGEEAVFDLYAWGQDDSISLKYNDQWVAYDAETGKVKLVDDAMHLGASAANKSNGKLTDSTMPGNARREWVDKEAGTFRLLANTFTGGFFNEFEESYYTEAAYLTSNGDSNLGIGCKKPAGSVDNVESVRTQDTIFTEEVVNETGDSVQITEDGVAVVVIGVSPTLSAGEGTDRVDLDLGAEQYELCHNVAEKYPGKTVVVKVSSPVNLQELQDDKNIGAILYQPYAGQYEGLALANLLFGEAEPSGRLTNTWYNTTDVLPQIDNTIIHNDWAKEGITLEDLDPARDVLMTNGDPYDTQLTYMYNKNDDAVTYEFGYGLSYGDYEYRSIQCSNNASSDKPFTVTVEVANLTNKEHYEVVQLYAQAVDSPYGDAEAEKQLIAFEKVLVPAASSAYVELTVDPQDLVVYTAQNQDLTVLSGKYKLMAGSSSENIQQTKTITISGEALEALNATERTDVFASAYAANDVYYREYNRQSTIDNLKADKLTDGYYSVVSKNKDSWVAVANVNLKSLEGMKLEVAAKDTSGTIEVHLGSPTGTLLATAEVPDTGSTTYVLENSGVENNSDIQITEQKFVTVDAKINADVSSLSSEDLYFVFKNPELRLASFKLTQGNTSSNTSKFTDVPANQWYAEAVDFVTSKNLFNGTSETTFSPNNNMNRAMIVTVLARLAGQDTSKGSTWYEVGVNWAKEKGISDGTNLNSFVSRE